MSREVDMMSAIADLLADYPVRDVLITMSDAVDAVADSSGDRRFSEAASTMRAAAVKLSDAEREYQFDVGHGAEVLADALVAEAAGR